MSSQPESSSAAAQRAYYTSSTRNRMSFLRTQETPGREQSPSFSLLPVDSSPYGSEGPITPTPRPLAGGPRASFSSSTRVLHSDQLLPPGNQDHARNIPQPTAPASLLSQNNENSFQIFGNFYLYAEEYHESWIEWWKETMGFAAYTAKYAGKKRIKWNSELRGTEVWKYFQQCADRSGSLIGMPRVMCIICRKVLAHPSGTGTSSMHDHNRSAACQKSRKFNGFDSGGSCTPDVLELLQKGTKTGNRRKIIDLATPAGFHQHDFEEYFLKSFLATNLPLNCSNNLAFRRAFRYARPGIEIPSPTTMTRHLKQLSNSTVNNIRTVLPLNAKISLAADTWTSPNKLAFLAIVAYWVSDDWQMEEVLIGFEEIKGSHTGANMAGIITKVLSQYGIQDKILGFTTDSASNNKTLAEALNNEWSSQSVEWSQLENHIPCMAHIVQLILGAFMNSIKVKSKDSHMPSGFKADYIEKVLRLDNGFHKTVEKHRKMSIAIGASPQRRQHFIEIQNDRVQIPTTLLYDVKTRWNSTLNMLERSLRLRDFTKDWLQTYPEFVPLWSTPEEWKQVEYILEVLQPIRFWTLWMSKTRGVTIHRVFQVYQDIFDHLEIQIVKLEQKRMQWKVDIRQGLLKAKSKAAVYYGKTENPRGILFGIGACLNPYCKLNLFREWDYDETSGETEHRYEKSYRKAFLAYYDLHYAPRNIPCPETPIPRSSLNSRSKHLYGSRPRGAAVSEALAYIDSNSEIEPPQPATEAVSSTYNPSPAGIFYEANILEWWKINAGRFPNLARMARDVLAVQGGSVGVERVFSMARDVIPYRRSRLKSSTIRASMLVKSYEYEELRRELANHDSEREAERLEERSAVEDYRFSAVRNEQSLEDDNGCISDEDESQKKDIAWCFVDQDGRRAFGKEPRPILPDRGWIESQYACPASHQSQGGIHQLTGSEESEDDDRVWDSVVVNMYSSSDTEGEEGSQSQEPEIAQEAYNPEENYAVHNTNNSREGLAGEQEEESLEEDAELEMGDSLSTTRATRESEQADYTGSRATTRKRAGTGGKRGKRSRFN